MFYDLIKNLNADMGAGLFHATKHMFSAGMIGGKVLKWLNSVMCVGGHAAAISTAPGVGNAAITGYLRMSNGALSAMFCEYMGWAFVKDFKNGKMNVKDKSKEALAFVVFYFLAGQFSDNWDFEKPAQVLQEKAAKALGFDIVNNLSGSNAEFVQAAMKFLSLNPISKAAKGIELITPAIAAHIVENKGNLNQDFLINTIKGSIYSLVCSDIFGDISNNDLFKEKTKKLIIYMRQDPQIEKLINNTLTQKGIKSGAEIILKKDTVNSLQAVYNEVVPKIVEIAGNIRSV